MGSLEQRIAKWRAFKELRAQGQRVEEAAKQVGISASTGWRWDAVDEEKQWRERWDSMIRAQSSAERNERLVTFVTANPGIATKKVAREFAITPERVRQLAIRAGVAGLLARKGGPRKVVAA